MPVVETLTSKVNLSRERLEEISQRSQITGERVRDFSLSRAYGLGAVALSGIADVGERVPLMGERAGGLRERAASWQKAGQAVVGPPIADYDDLNVKQVSEALEGLNEYELEKVRRYEVANKDRVTVLRAIDSLLG